MTPSANVVPIMTKSTATVPWSEVEPLFNRIRTALDCPAREVLHTIGYDSGSSVAKWTRDGKCPLRVKYALLGMAAELQVQRHQPKAVTIFSHQELADIFGLTLGLILPGTTLHALQTKLAKALAGQAQEPLP